EDETDDADEDEAEDSDEDDSDETETDDADEDSGEDSDEDETDDADEDEAEDSDEDDSDETETDENDSDDDEAADGTVVSSPTPTEPAGTVEPSRPTGVTGATGLKRGGVPVGPVAAGAGAAVVTGALARRVLASGAGGATGAAAPLETAVRVHASSVRTSVRAASSVLDSLPERLWRVVATAGYLKHAGEDPLAHETRAALYEHLETHPGTYLTAFEEDSPIEAGRGTIRYHLGILEREGLVTSERRGGKRRYYPIGMDPDALSIAMESPTPAAILESLADSERTVSDLADRVDRDPSTVSYHLERLADDGLVERQRDGEAVINRLTPGAASMLGDPVGRRVESSPTSS
ncbi:MAG: helix-turn-helix domain-containing protein, partial [Haloarculaceae archaeon]